MGFSIGFSSFLFYRSRIHERTISLRGLCIFLRVLRLEVSVRISYTIGKGVWFSIGFSSFLLYRSRIHERTISFRGPVHIFESSQT
jgi:hypothetical protein